MPAAPYADATSHEKGHLTAKRARIKTLVLASARLQPPVSRKGKKGAGLSLDALGG